MRLRIGSRRMTLTEGRHLPTLGFMMVLLVATLIVLGAPASTTASTTDDAATDDKIRPVPDAGEMLWASRYTGIDDFGTDRGKAVVASSDGTRLFVTGSSENPMGMVTLAYDALTGDLLWEARQDGLLSLSAHQAIALSADGTKLIVAGNSLSDSTNTDYVTVAYDSESGEELWVSRYDGPGSGPDFPCPLPSSKCLTVSETAVFVTGSSADDPPEFGADDMATVAYDLDTGEEMWVARYDGPGEGNDGGSAVTLSPDESTVVVAGDSVGIGTGIDIATIAYDASTGDELWVARHDGPASEIDNPFALVVGPTGDTVFVAGFERGEDGRFPNDPVANDYVTLAYDVGTGEQLWHATYDGGVEHPGYGRDTARAVAVSPDGSNVFITGHSAGNERDTECCGVIADWDATTIAYDTTNGEESWVARHDGPANANDIGYAIVATEDRVFVGGEALQVPADPPIPAANRDYLTASYDPDTGEELWAQYYGPSEISDTVFALTAVEGPLGYRVYVTGDSTHHVTGPDIATVAYIDVLPERRPALGLDISEISSEQPPDQVVTRSVAISNDGGSDLHWAIFGDPPLPSGDDPPDSIIRTADPGDVNRDRANLTTNPDATDSGEVILAESGVSADDMVTLSHSASENITIGNSLACVAQFGGTYGASYLRAFTLHEFDIPTGLEITEVAFGIENLEGIDQTLTVNLYRLNGEHLTYEHMTRIGSAAQELGPQTGTIVTIPVSGTALAGSTLVVEVDAPRVVGVGTFFIGSNAQGQTAPSYFSSVPCGAPEPVDLADVDAPNMHIVMSVTGMELPACADPDTTEWLDVVPLSGTLEPDGEQILEVNIDSTGLQGDHSANLCVQSNDSPALVMIPVHLSVTENPPSTSSTSTTSTSSTSTTSTTSTTSPPPSTEPPPTTGPEPHPGFDDVPEDHLFFDDIIWLATEGITIGCNPPDNTLFCPEDSVTRGQMAAFLNRALNLAATDTDHFVDDDESVFEDDINLLAESRITLGCNPPENTEFCPTDDVLRQQMASFLVRAYDLEDQSGIDRFIDDDFSVHEDDIEALADSGVTFGCNPPDNTMYCPLDDVLRQQMAAFLHRVETR